MNILTFDVEDWYNHDDYSRDFSWEKYEVRIYDGVEKILSILADKKLKGTFFCVGWLAEHHPRVIRWISDAGHHLGCHSYQHELATRFNREQFFEDTYKAKCLIENASGVSVDAFRVPSFSITKDNLWTFDVLTELGFVYDSSVFPSNHEFGGLPTFPAVPHIIKTQRGMLKEFPVSLGRILAREVVYSGGGYFRIMPYCLLKQITGRSGYVLSYFHPSDFDPNQPQMPHLPWIRQFKNRIALKGAYEKFSKYLSDFSFIDILTADEQIDWEQQMIVKLEQTPEQTWGMLRK